MSNDTQTAPNDQDPDTIPTKLQTFADLGVDDELVRALADNGIETAFPIQALTLPTALSGADVIGQARTGTGKTLAFGLALLQRIDPGGPTPQALVIVPTRELCLQVSNDLEIGVARGLGIVSIYGGVGYDDQLAKLRGGAHIVVGTPGRLLDLKQRGDLDLSHVRELVLDEADEMLDMGFLPDVEQLISACPDDRHTMLFSATMPSEVVRLGRRYMNQPTFMRADQEEHETAPTVAQHFFQVHRMDKPRILARLLQAPERGGCFVFVRTKAMADRLVRDLEDLGVTAVAVHGDLRQASREKNLQRFRDGKADVLVATEVAARGLDVDNVSHVVNYDCPDDEKMYLHRIGRTARAGQDGVAVTFAQFNEVERANLIRKALGLADGPIREVFSTSDELTELFDLPTDTPWDRKGSKSLAPKSDLPVGKVADPDAKRSGAARRRSQTADDTPEAASRPRTRSRDRDTRKDRETGQSAPATERVRTRERTRTTADSNASSDRPKSSERDGQSPARARKRGGDRRQDQGKGGNGRSKGHRSTSRGDGRQQQKARSKQNGGRRDRREVSVEAARGDGQPRHARRVKVEHLP
ncbi:MAG: DEAD/DEAH box helicase [Nitriliruptorales bacterium]|nr:DEAD/DEAH box helicase [Nitriliruptorales bacterium]